MAIFLEKKTNQKSFLKKDIIKNNLSIISFCKKNRTKQDFIIVSVISPLKKTRFFAQKLFKNNYYEIKTYSSLKVLEKRDVKGLYKLAKLGKLKNLIGYNSKIKYETSKHKHLRINTGKLSKKESLKKILKYLKNMTKMFTKIITTLGPSSFNSKTINSFKNWVFFYIE